MTKEELLAAWEDRQILSIKNFCPNVDEDLHAIIENQLLGEFEIKARSAGLAIITNPKIEWSENSIFITAIAIKRGEL